MVGFARFSDFMVSERRYELTALDLVPEHSHITHHDTLAQCGSSEGHVATWEQLTLFCIDSLYLVCP
jgi:hypothetical protein